MTAKIVHKKGINSIYLIHFNFKIVLLQLIHLPVRQVIVIKINVKFR